MSTILTVLLIAVIIIICVTMITIIIDKIKEIKQHGLKAISPDLWFSAFMWCLGLWIWGSLLLMLIVIVVVLGLIRLDEMEEFVWVCFAVAMASAFGALVLL